MKKLQRHWRAITVMMVLVVSAGGTVWWHNAAGSASADQEPPGYEPVSEIQRDAVRNLMERVHLDREALIALNPSPQQAESLVSAVRTWHADHTATLAARKQTIDLKKVDLYRMEKAERLGPPDVGRKAALKVARQDLITARDAYTAALAPLQAEVNTLLSASQRATWSTIRLGQSRQMPFRLLNLTDQQRMAINKAQRVAKRQRAAADTTEKRQTAIANQKATMAQVLTTDQKAVMAGYRLYRKAASHAVAQALDTVLLTEEEITPFGLP